MNSLVFASKLFLSLFDIFTHSIFNSFKYFEKLPSIFSMLLISYCLDRNKYTLFIYLICGPRKNEPQKIKMLSIITLNTPYIYIY